MKKWYEFIPDLYTYNPYLNVYPENVRLSGELSPLTNFFLNIFANSLEKRNLIVAIPDIILRPISILSYLYAFLKNRSVIVFTQKNLVDSHYKKYHLLNDGSRYLFYEIPLGIISDECVEAKIYMPRAKIGLKQRYIQKQKENFLEDSKPKVLLCQNDKKIDNNIIDKIIIDEGRLDNFKVNFDLGLIIFENVDRFVYSQYSTQVFLGWLSPLLEEEITFIFHFSNSESKFINTIKEKTDSLAMLFGTALLKSNEELQKVSINYFEERSKDWKKAEMELINKYNIDRQHFYENITTIEIAHPLLKAGNINYHFKITRNLLRKINEDRIKNKKLYYLVKSFLFKLPNLAINPSKYKELYSDDFVNWRYYTIPQMLQMFRDRLSEENEDNIIYLEGLISEVYSIYLELKECRRYKEEETYSRIAKDYKILEMIEEVCKHNCNEIVVATYSPFERNILEGDVNGLQLENGFKIETIAQINRSIFDVSEKTLVLPGPVRMKYLSVLLQPYKKIIVLAYEGENYNLAKGQIDLFYKYSIEREENLMSYLEEIYNFIGIPKDSLFKSYYERKKRNKLESVDDEKTTPVGGLEKNETDFLNRIKDIIKIEPRYIHYKEYDDEITKLENILAELDKKPHMIEKYITSAFYEVSLRKVGETQIIKKLLPVEKTYIYLEKKDGKVHEGTPINLKPGFYVIILDNDERKTLLDLIVEIFGLKQSVDKHLIELWKERLIKFINMYNLSYQELYKLYIKNKGKRKYHTVLNWTKGNVLAPDDPVDIQIIGKILKDEEIIENYEIIYREANKLRNIHRIVGRKLRKIIKEVLRGELDPTKLNYEEYAIYEKIESGFYEVVGINKKFNNGDIK